MRCGSLLGALLLCAASASAQSPRLLAPLSGTFVLGGRPRMRWERTPGAVLELCRERACRTVLGTVAHEESALAPANLPPGALFWRVRSPAGTSATWELFVGHGGPSTTPAAAAGHRLDVDADGFVDVVAMMPDAMRLYAGSRAGLSAAPRSVGPTVSAQFDAAGDVDGDGYGDFVQLTRLGHEELLFFRGSSAGTLTLSQTVALPWSANNPSPSVLRGAGDVDGDGYGDVVVSNACEPIGAGRWIQGSLIHSCGGGAVHVYFGSPRGLNLARTQTLAPSVGPDYRFGVGLGTGVDLDGDGRTEVLVDGGRRAWVLRGSASGLLAPSASHVLPGWLLGRLGDFEGDGQPDFLALEDGERRTAAHALNPRTGALTSLAIDVADTLPLPSHLLGVGDFDGDGRSDVLAASYTSGEVRLYAAGRRSELLWGPARERVTVDAVVAGLGDVDGDGYDDFALRLLYPTELHLFYGQPASVRTPRRHAVRGYPEANFAFFGRLTGTY